MAERHYDNQISGLGFLCTQHKNRLSLVLVEGQKADLTWTRLGYDMWI